MSTQREPHRGVMKASRGIEGNLLLRKTIAIAIDLEELAKSRFSETIIVRNRPGDRRDAADAIRRVDPGIEKQSQIFNAKRRLRWGGQLKVERCPRAQMDRISKGICPFDPGRNTLRTCRGPGRSDREATVGFRAECLIDPAIGIPIDLDQRGLRVDPVFTGDELSD